MRRRGGEERMREEGRKREKGRKETFTSFILIVWNAMPDALGIFTYLILKPTLRGGIIPTVEVKTPRLQLVTPASAERWSRAEL